MSKIDRSFTNRLSNANVLSDGLLKEVSYGDYSLMMVAKDRPEDNKGNPKGENITTLK